MSPSATAERLAMVIPLLKPFQTLTTECAMYPASATAAVGQALPRAVYAILLPIALHLL